MAVKSSDGKRCTRAPVVGGDFCTQHSKVKNVHRISELDPWTVHPHLPVPCPDNGKRFLQKLRTQLNKPLAKTDTQPGHIYIYYLDSERGCDFWKIGRTARSVDKRLEEWNQTHKGDVRLQQSFAMERGVKRAELIIHLYLAYCRVYRYGSSEDIHRSEWAFPLPDASRRGEGRKDLLPFPPRASRGEGKEEKEYSSPPRAKRGEGRKERAVAKQVEWFCEELDKILPIVQAVTWHCENKMKIDSSPCFINPPASPGVREAPASPPMCSSAGTLPKCEWRASSDCLAAETLPSETGCS